MEFHLFVLTRVLHKLGDGSEKNFPFFSFPARTSSFFRFIASYLIDLITFQRSLQAMNVEKSLCDCSTLFLPIFVCMLILDTEFDPLL